MEREAPADAPEWSWRRRRNGSRARVRQNGRGGVQAAARPVSLPGRVSCALHVAANEVRRRTDCSE